MKVSQQELLELKSHVEPLDTAERRQKYQDGLYPRAHFTKDLYTRYCWDLYFDCGYSLNGGDLKDSHLYTALRKVIPDFN